MINTPCLSRAGFDFRHNQYLQKVKVYIQTDDVKSLNLGQRGWEAVGFTDIIIRHCVSGEGRGLFTKRNQQASRCTERVIRGERHRCWPVFQPRAGSSRLRYNYGKSTCICEAKPTMRTICYVRPPGNKEDSARSDLTQF